MLNNLITAQFISSNSQDQQQGEPTPPQLECMQFVIERLKLEMNLLKLECTILRERLLLIHTKLQQKENLIQLEEQIRSRNNSDNNTTLTLLQSNTNKKQENKTKRSQKKEIKRLFVAVLEWWRLLVASLRYRTKQKFIWKQILYFFIIISIGIFGLFREGFVGEYIILLRNKVQL